MQIEMLSTRELIPYINNPRNNEKAVDYVANSIKEFGFKVPIVVDKNNVIVAGHTRLLASEKLGLEKVPVIRANDLTEEQVRAYRLADNKTAEASEWDLDLLIQELEELELEIDMEKFGFDDINNDINLDDVYEEVEPRADENATPKLSWGGKSVDISEQDVMLLDAEYADYEQDGSGQGFVRWLLNESDVSGA